LQTLAVFGRNLIAAMLVAAAAGGTSAARPELQHWRCRNAASGANWTIAVDAGTGQVDGFPAKISKSRASWRDPARGFFDLDRRSGDLQMRNASSTGGYFMHFQCRRE
jgi:hypothetical protein